MQCFPNLFITVAHFDFENFPWHTLKVFPAENKVISEKKSLHQNSSGFSGREQVISWKQKLQTRLFKNTTFTKMLWGPLQNVLWPTGGPWPTG